MCGKKREKPSSERKQLEPKLLPSENAPTKRNLLALTTKPQPRLHSLKSKMEFFAGPKNTEANLSFVERAQLQKTQVFCSLHNVVAISYFEQTKPQPKTHGLMSV